MGCDIHWILERKTKNYGWVGVRTSYDEHEVGSADPRTLSWRNYKFFAALAGVRGDGPDCKDWPDNASQLALDFREVWDGDGHSHSWETLEDFCRIRETSLEEEKVAALMAARMQGDNTPLAGKYFDYLKDDTPYRVLFYFDN